MEVHWAAIVAQVFGTMLVLGVIAVVLHYRLAEERSRIETEIQRMEVAYHRARESFSR